MYYHTLAHEMCNQLQLPPEHDIALILRISAHTLSEVQYQPSPVSQPFFPPQDSGHYTHGTTERLPISPNSTALSMRKAIICFSKLKDSTDPSQAFVQILPTYHHRPTHQPENWRLTSVLIFGRLKLNPVCFSSSRSLFSWRSNTLKDHLLNFTSRLRP